MTVLALHSRALTLTGPFVAAVRPEDLPRPTPCAEWDLGTLLRHIVSENHAFAVAVRYGTAEDWGGGSLGSDPYAAFTASADAVRAAFAEEGALDRTVTVREFGQFPGAVALSMHLIDTVVHGWDIASAMGLRYEPDDELLAAAARIAERIPSGDGTRGPGTAFGPVVPVPDDAPTFHRVPGLLGRSPDWALVRD